MCIVVVVVMMMMMMMMACLWCGGDWGWCWDTDALEAESLCCGESLSKPLCVLSWSGFGQRQSVCLVVVRVWLEATCWPFVVALDRMFETIEHMQNNIWLRVNGCGLQTGCGQQPIGHVWTTEQVWTADENTFWLHTGTGGGLQTTEQTWATGWKRCWLQTGTHFHYRP